MEKPDEIVVDECKVTDLQSELSADEIELTVEFEAGGAINTPTLGNMAMTKIATARLVSPADLSSLVKECEETEARSRDLILPELEGTAGVRWVWLPTTLGFAFAIISFFVLLKRTS